MPMRMTATVLSAMMVLQSSPAFAKRNDDVVVMKNGDRITGEIKKLVQGKLYFKADYMADSVQLDWADVERLESKDQFNVSLTTGRIYTGNIEKRGSVEQKAADFQVFHHGSLIQVSREQVTVITPVEDTFLKQLTGSIDYGFSFTGGDNVTQSSLSADLDYRAERWSFQANGSSVFNAQSDSETSGRNTLNMLYARYLTQKWFAAAVGDLLSSRQQDLKLRTSAGGGLGRVLVRTSNTWLGVISGVNVSNERYDPASGNTPQVNNAEALFHLKYTMARFTSTQVKLGLYAYPSMTTVGRVRTGLQAELRLELFRNAFWKFSVYENFDNQPPIRAPRNDFGTSTSVGWKF